MSGLWQGWYGLVNLVVKSFCSWGTFFSSYVCMLNRFAHSFLKFECLFSVTLFGELIKWNSVICFFSRILRHSIICKFLNLFNFFYYIFLIFGGYIGILKIDFSNLNFYWLLKIICSKIWNNILKTENNLSKSSYNKYIYKYKFLFGIFSLELLQKQNNIYTYMGYKYTFHSI